ncbi:MAG TPA: hypothetical protein HA254_06900 [Candidatus Diapherotrites archaeon]|uniref:Uncharacterized protein n=1 Tax=Candidatus Iainarchaeum sp. TaxID=3101447 RepID=A0A7J4IXT5_9ARCH|nr:hypothetical protein [Candidatus Diapherotrites archaeon]
MNQHKQTADLLKTGKAKAKARIEIALEYLKRHAKADSTNELIKAGIAKKKARKKIVERYISGLQQAY